MLALLVIPSLTLLGVGVLDAKRLAAHGHPHTVRIFRVKGGPRAPVVGLHGVKRPRLS